MLVYFQIDMGWFCESGGSVSESVKADLDVKRKQIG